MWQEAISVVLSVSTTGILGDSFGWCNCPVCCRAFNSLDLHVPHGSSGPRVTMRSRDISFFFLTNKVFTPFLKKNVLYLFLERVEGTEKERERKKEKHHCVVASCTPPIRDLARNPGMCPDLESNRPPFGPQARTQSSELHQPGETFPYAFQFSQGDDMSIAPAENHWTKL